MKKYTLIGIKDASTSPMTIETISATLNYESLTAITSFYKGCNFIGYTILTSNFFDYNDIKDDYFLGDK